MARLPRASGILLHPTSLPGPFGIGDLGPAACAFIAFLAQAGQRWWQMLPLGPVEFDGSPYQSPSSQAGNWLLISPELLATRGLLDQHDLDEYAVDSSNRVDFVAVSQAKNTLLDRAYRRFDSNDPDFTRFLEENHHWLDDYALFKALKEAHGGRSWTAWPEPIARRHPESVAHARTALRDRIRYFEYIEFLFDSQWNELREFARRHAIHIIGDLPIYVALDSVDVWTRPELFRLDEHGQPTFLAGVPEDDFNPEGQLWGNPLYDWDAHQREGFQWWIDRIKGLQRRVDLIRLDHFRGFQSYYQIPAGSLTALGAPRIDGPDVDPANAPFLSTLRQVLGDLPLIAEDLGGDIPPEVYELRDRFDIPGMRILQFAFGGGSDHPYLPHNFPRPCVAYTGTHDTDTLQGWLESLHAASAAGYTGATRYLDHATRYLGCDPADLGPHMVSATLLSVADTAIMPLQDVLGLGGAARMNRPGIVTPLNWSWRYLTQDLDHVATQRLAQWTSMAGRWNGWQAPP